MGLPHFYLFSPTESVISISISQISNCIFSKHFDDPLAKKTFSLSFLLLSLPFIFIVTYYFMTPESAILSDDMALFTAQLGKTKFD